MVTYQRDDPLAACRREAGKLAWVEHAMVMGTTRVTK